MAIRYISSYSPFGLIC